MKWYIAVPMAKDRYYGGKYLVADPKLALWWERPENAKRSEGYKHCTEAYLGVKIVSEHDIKLGENKHEEY